MTETNSNPPILSKEKGMKPPPGPFQGVFSVASAEIFKEAKNNLSPNSSMRINIIEYPKTDVIKPEPSDIEYKTLEGIEATLPRNQILVEITGGDHKERNALLEKWYQSHLDSKKERHSGDKV